MGKDRQGWVLRAEPGTAREGANLPISFRQASGWREVQLQLFRPRSGPAQNHPKQLCRALSPRDRGGLLWRGATGQAFRQARPKPPKGGPRAIYRKKSRYRSNCP